MFTVRSALSLIVLLAIFSIVAGKLVSANPLGQGEIDDPVERRWQEYKTKYNKSYGDGASERIAFENFMENLRKVVEHNSKSRQFRMDVNHMSDWSEQQYQQLNNFVSPSRRMNSKLEDLDDSDDFEESYKNYQAPSSVDYRTDSRRVGPVKDQGACGADWAFATVGLLEGQQRMNSTGGVMSLSEQNLIDCDRAGKNHGCNGGNYEDALAFIKANGGIEIERDYPYASTNGEDNFECKYKPENAFITTRYLTESVRLVSGNEPSLRENVARYGPVAVTIDASLDSFRNYKSGVYFDERCSSTKINHAVLLVGYGTNEQGEDFWIIKNSWSESWGLNGYALIARNKNNHCGLATYAVLSLAKKAY